MNEHAGPACALSVLIVGIFAILLHERDRPPRPERPTVREWKDAEPARPSPTSALVSENAIRETVLVAPAPRPAEEPAPVREKVADGSRVAARPRASRAESSGKVERSVPTRPPAQSRPRPTRPRSPFTVVGRGETLADVATRVYGSPDAKEAVWKANRDQVARIDSPLPQGTLLRTP